MSKKKKEEFYTEDDLMAAREMMEKRGESIKVKKNMFNLTGTKKYTLKEAIELAQRGKLTSKCKIPEFRYAELIALYIKYSTAIMGDGVCKEINVRFFNPTNKDRYVMKEFTERLKSKGWNFESPHKRKYTEKKLQKIAEAKAALRGGM